MKQLIALSLTALTAIVLFSCSKDAVYKEDHLNPTIFGKWNIVTDSGYSGVGLGNHAVNYSGKPGDYFDFRTDGYLYIKEGRRHGNFKLYNNIGNHNTNQFFWHYPQWRAGRNTGNQP